MSPIAAPLSLRPLAEKRLRIVLHDAPERGDDAGAAGDHRPAAVTVARGRDFRGADPVPGSLAEPSLSAVVADLRGATRPC